MNDGRILTAENRLKIVALSLGALLVIGGVAWFYDANQWAIHQAHQAKIDALNHKLMESRKLAILLNQTVELRAQMQQFVDAQEGTMVDGDQFAWVIREIGQLAESQLVNNNVTILPGTVSQQTRKPALQCYVTHLEFVGDYDQIGLFIKDLENHFPEAEIRSLAILATETPAAHRASLDLALLVRPAGPSDSATAAPKTEPKS